MKHSIKHKSESNLEITITLGAADLAEVKPRTLQRVAKDMKIAGFRAGKVPPAIAEKNLDPNVLSREILEDAINNSATTVFEEAKLHLLSQPQVDVKKYVAGQELEYVVTVEVLPEVKLGDYKALKAKKQEVTVSDADVDEVIERIRRDMATKADVERAAKDGDDVMIDFKGTDKDGNAVKGADGQDYPLALGSKSFIPGFEEGLVGHKKGDKFDLPLKFPKDYHAKSLAGAKVTFEVTVKGVKEVVLPEVTDEFAAKTGPFKTVAELKTDIKRELTDQREKDAIEKLKNELVEQLVKGSHIPTPDVLVADQEQALERDFMQNLQYRGMSLEQYLERQGLSEKDWRAKELRPQAVRRVEIGLALAELGKVESITVSAQELDERMRQLMEQYGNKPEFKAQIASAETRREMANQMVTHKTIERLLDLNKH